jgi:hypothetical protein
MRSDDWTPGWSLNKAYPYNGIESKRMLVNRPTLGLIEGKVHITWDPEIFPEIADDQSRRTELEEFLFNRLFDYYETLAVAEGQVQDILEEKPFLPEDFGFILAHKNPDITQPPVRIYLSRYSPNTSLFRKTAPEGFVSNPALWTILTKNVDGSFQENDVMIPCERIAYALFYAMRIQMTEFTLPEVITPLQPLNGPQGELKDNYFRVRFIRNWERECVNIDETIDVEADTVSDALTRAKFHFETSGNKEYSDITPEELSIVS